MSTTHPNTSPDAAEKRNREDLDHQVAGLATAYADAGKHVMLYLQELPSSASPSRKHYILFDVARGEERMVKIDSWVAMTTVEMWLVLFSMRRALSHVMQHNL